MSLITRCPACSTMFKVVPDQLKVSEGWVRCGHCSEVFDAQAHLQAALAPEPEAAPAMAQSHPHEEEDSALAEPDREHSPLPPQNDWQRLPDPPEQPVQVSPEQQAWVPDDIQLASHEETVDSYVIEEAPRMEMPVTANANPLDDVFASPLPEAVGDAVAGAGPADLSAAREAADEHADLGFVRQAQRKAWWARPVVRAVLALLVLALLLLLGLQVVVQERDQIAAQIPQARGALQALCGTLGCKVSPLRQIDAIQIDSSTFNKSRGDSYRLAFVIRNSAAVALATPAMELTLTDTQDQPVLRRVLLPSDMPGAPPVLAAGAEWPASLSLAVDPGSPRVSGYRLMAFYP